MIIAGRFSFAGGEEIINTNYQALLDEVVGAIERVDASTCKTKHSKEKTMKGGRLFSPRALNKLFKRAFAKWIEKSQSFVRIFS